MSNYDEMKREITIPRARLAFPALFTPDSYDEKSPKQFGAVLLMPEDDKIVGKVRKLYTEVAEAKWGKGAAALLKQIEHNPQTNCFLDGNLKEHLDGYANHMYINAKNKKRPTVVDRDGSPLVEADGKPYAGCYVLAKIEFWAQQNSNGKAMRASLLGVQFREDGDSFTAGRVASADEFEDLTVGEDDDDLL